VLSVTTSKLSSLAATYRTVERPDSAPSGYVTKESLRGKGIRVILAPNSDDQEMPGLIDAVASDALRAVLDASRQIPHNGRRDRVDGDVDALHRPA